MCAIIGSLGAIAVAGINETETVLTELIIVLSKNYVWPRTACPKPLYC